MAFGDITMDGGPLPPRTGREMCEYVVAAGLYLGKPEELWNYSSTGELSCVFDLYYMALSVNGHQLAIEMPDGTYFSWPILGRKKAAHERDQAISDESQAVAGRDETSSRYALEGNP